MKMNIAQWIVCSAACMAVGCSGLERHIRPSEQATVYASPSLQSDAVSQSKTGIDTPLDQNHAFEVNRFRKPRMLISPLKLPVWSNPLPLTLSWSTQ